MKRRNSTSDGPSTNGGGNTQQQQSEKQPSLQELLERRRKLEEDINKLEVQIFNLEGSYLEETWAQGNCVRGWDSYISARGRGAAAGGFKKKSFKDVDRIFSYGSATSARAVGGEADCETSLNTSTDALEDSSDTVASDTATIGLKKRKRLGGSLLSSSSSSAVATDSGGGGTGTGTGTGTVLKKWKKVGRGGGAPSSDGQQQQVGPGRRRLVTAAATTAADPDSSEEYE